MKDDRHPGRVLKDSILLPRGITQQRLAKAIGVSRRSINELVNGGRAMTPRMALCLARVTGTDAKTWMELQVEYDLDLARKCMGAELAELKVLAYAR